MDFDDFDLSEPIVDLIYPSVEKKNMLKARRNKLNALPQDYVANLELEKLADLISNHYSYRIVKMFQEMCTDEETITYRLDILDDFLNIPALAPTVRKIINIMLENDRTTVSKLEKPDSFALLDEAITAFEAYIECMEIMHKFYMSNKEKVKSAGITKMFQFFEEQYGDKHYISLKKELEELKAAIFNHIRSVTVAINLNERLIPESVGIIEVSDKSYTPKPTFLDRILYHGAKFSDKTVMGNLRQKYRSSDTSSPNDLIINEVDKTLFSELDKVTGNYVHMISDVLAEYQRVGFDDLKYLDYQLEFYVGFAKLVENCRSKGLGMCRPKILPMSEHRASFKGVYDMIYFGEAMKFNLYSKDKKSVVPNDIDFDQNASFYVLTGANNGGKTTFVRGVGICQLMAQAGVYVPCESCEVSLCDYIYTHFPKEEETGINSSRFTTEIKEFKTISDTITNNSMLLMNESIQSTTPKECVDIAATLMKIFCKVGVRGIFATHMIELAYKAEELNNDPAMHSKLESIVVTVDEESGERKYLIKKAMPTQTSYANAVFEQFGINMESIEKRIAEMYK